MSRDIWFKKVLWSYMPCNAKGWAFIGILVAFLLCSLGVVGRFTNEGVIRDILQLFVVAAVFSYAWWVSERHS